MKPCSPNLENSGENGSPLGRKGLENPIDQTPPAHEPRWSPDDPPRGSPHILEETWGCAGKAAQRGSGLEVTACRDRTGSPRPRPPAPPPRWEPEWKEVERRPQVASSQQTPEWTVRVGGPAEGDRLSSSLCRLSVPTHLAQHTHHFTPSGVLQRHSLDSRGLCSSQR